MHKETEQLLIVVLARQEQNVRLTCLMPVLHIVANLRKITTTAKVLRIHCTIVHGTHLNTLNVMLKPVVRLILIQRLVILEKEQVNFVILVRQVKNVCQGTSQNNVANSLLKKTAKLLRTR